MHPLVAIGLVFLAVPAWLGTIVTLLIALAKARQRPQADIKGLPIHNSDETAAPAELGAK
ncbi:hypothetical protein J7I84_06855 [Arthrobacter sp. ISL-85]|uniref:hypothetical protein n=1 Tax=Arthrobacter sp. ISL-85 TaxID=2819115 RepID=UPI001BEBC57B|nr:hypothetical protein [Arthrobacter sp. ISL-85]MBT2566222.1 hypothetical protein [Arthrobacter sp. ISL-85]